MNTMTKEELIRDLQAYWRAYNSLSENGNVEACEEVYKKIKAILVELDEMKRKGL